MHRVGRGATHVEGSRLAVGQDDDAPCVGIAAVAPMRREIDSGGDAEAPAEIHGVVRLVAAVTRLAAEQRGGTGRQRALVAYPFILPCDVEQSQRFGEGAPFPEESVDGRVLSFPLNLPQLVVLARIRILGKGVGGTTGLGFEEESAVLVHEAVIPVARWKERPLLVTAIEGVVQSDGRIVLDTAILCFHAEVRVWLEHGDAPAGIAFIVEAQELAAVTLNLTFEGGDTGKGVGVKPDGQVTSRMLVADLAIVIGIVFCLRRVKGFACRHLQVVKSDGVASIGEGKGVDSLAQRDEGGTAAGQEILERVGRMQGCSRDRLAVEGQGNACPTSSSRVAKIKYLPGYGGDGVGVGDLRALMVEHDHLTLRCAFCFGNITCSIGIFRLQLLPPLAPHDRLGQVGMLLGDGCAPVAEGFIEDAVRKDVIEEKVFIVVVLPRGASPRVTRLVNGANQVISLDGLDVDGETLVGEADAVCPLLKELIAVGQRLVRHLKISTVVCLDCIALISVVVGHVLNQELGGTILQGVRVVLEVRQDLLQFCTVVACLLEGTFGDTVTRQQASCPKKGTYHHDMNCAFLHGFSFLEVKDSVIGVATQGDKYLIIFTCGVV